MSTGGNQWAGPDTSVTGSVVISIPDKARTDPPDKQRSLSDKETLEGGHVTSRVQQQAERVRRSEPILAEQYQESHTFENQRYRYRKKHQDRITNDKQAYLQSIWIPNEQQEQLLQQQHDDDIDFFVNNSAALVLSEKEVVFDANKEEWSYKSASKESLARANSKHNIRNDSGNNLYKTDSDNNVILTFSSVSPRTSRCRRQNRVSSSDEPPCDAQTQEKNACEQYLYQNGNGNSCQSQINGYTLQLSSEEAESGQSAGPISHLDASALVSINDDPKEISHGVVNILKSSSLDKISVLNPEASVEGSLEKPWSSWRRKKNKPEVIEKSKANFSVSSCRLRGSASTQANSDQVDPKEEGPESQSRISSTKGPRRLAKRGIGMFPSSNWRRLRNTLKAANEMQSSRKQRHTLNREDSFLRKFSTRNHQNVQNASSSLDGDSRVSYYSSNKFEGRFVIQHDGNFMFYWLGIVTVSVLYNLWTCIAREAFREIQQGCPACWYSLDALFDFIYICDILVQFRTGYLDQGLMVYDSKKLRQKYAKSKDIYIDFICLLPLDLVQFAIGVHPMIRFPRFLKLYRPLRFLHMLESRTAYPNLIRVANLTHVLFLGAHWFAAFYYMISEAEGFKGEWSYPKPVGEFSDVNRKYLRSLFWSTLTLTTIGDIPPTGNTNDLRMSNAAYVFVIVSYLIGVFVFATIVGQVGNVINNRNASRQEFERLLDGAKIYMQTHSVPHNLQKRVQRWYDYVWSRGRLNGCDINSLGLLPDKLKTELAIHVNLETLKKVTIFQECQPEFLHDLVLKMKAYIFTPGDLICRRGEVAREMFIIADGVVEIISESGVMLKRMAAGDFFGEIGILNLDGGINRRTADVRSVGYLELFVLSREDVLAALKDHPEAESIIRDYGQRRLREVEAHRQKVKPLKCKGGTDQPGNLAGTPQTVQNRLLQTLRSLNPAVRRQSAQINNIGSPAGAGQIGNPVDLPRCVNQRSSPINKSSSALAKASSQTQSGLAVVSLDRTDFSTGNPASCFPGEYMARRQSFAYFRTAYARFRNVFQRRRGQRRSVDISDTRRRELWGENRLRFKSADNPTSSVDFGSNKGSSSPGCGITLNVEDCSQSSKMLDNNEDVDEKKNGEQKQEKSALSSGVKRGSLLFPNLPDIEARKLRQNLGRVIQRKYSEPVTYMPVCTEDLDERYSHRSREDVTKEETNDRSQIVLDVGKYEQFWDRKDSTVSGEGLSNSDANFINEEDVVYSETTRGNIISVNTSYTSDSRSENYDDTFNHSYNGSLKNTSNYDHISFKVNDHNEISNTLDAQTENLKPSTTSEGTISSFQSDTIQSIAREAIEKSSPYRPHCKSFSSFREKTTSSLCSPKQRLQSREPSIRSEGRTLTQTSSESSTSKHHSGYMLHYNAATEDTITPSSSLLTASPSPFTLSCHCDPADNFKKFIGCHLPESIHHKLIKRNLPGAELPSSRNRVESTGQLSINSELTQRTVTLSPCGCSQSGRSQSFPTLTEPLDDTRNTGLCLLRSPSCQLPEHFLFDEVSLNLSPKLTKLKEEEGMMTTRKGSSSGGRSHPMSIIQQPTSDFSYQQLTDQINIMQGMIERRLTLLEEAYSSTTEKLEYLATSQELLVRLLKQQLLANQNQECIQPRPNEDDDNESASLI